MSDTVELRILSYEGSGTSIEFLPEEVKAYGTGENGGTFVLFKSGLTLEVDVPFESFRDAYEHPEQFTSMDQREEIFAAAEAEESGEVPEDALEEEAPLEEDPEQPLEETEDLDG